ERTTPSPSDSDPALVRVPPPPGDDPLWRWAVGGIASALLCGLAAFAVLLMRGPGPGHTSPILAIAARGDDPAEELAGFRDRSHDRAADHEQLRDEVLAFRRRHTGSPLAGQAMALLRSLPGPLDRIDPKRQDLSDAGPTPPPGLVAVLGEPRQ